MSSSTRPRRRRRPRPPTTASRARRGRPHPRRPGARRTLGFLDQGAFWANLGVSLLGFAGVLAVLAPAGAPPLTVTAAVVATVVGTAHRQRDGRALGDPRRARPVHPRWWCCVACSAGCCRGSRRCSTSCSSSAGAPSSSSSSPRPGRSRSAGPTWAWVLGAGVVTTVLTLRPLGMLRLLRRVVTILVAISVAYLAWWLFTRPELDLGADRRVLVRVLGRDRRGDRGGGVVDPGGLGLLAPLAARLDRVHRGDRRATASPRSSASSSGSRRSRWSAGNGDEVFAPMLAAPFGLVALLVLTAARDRPVVRQRLLDRGLGAEPRAPRRPPGAVPRRSAR